GRLSLKTRVDWFMVVFLFLCEHILDSISVLSVCFRHTGPNGQHICMILEYLGDSLNLNKVREICRWVLLSLDYLHREVGIIHSKDPNKSGLSPILEKPEGSSNSSVLVNIVQPLRSWPIGGIAKRLRSLDGIEFRCKIVDFGNACWVDKPFQDEIQTRQYRAPEVVLGAGFLFSADMWSLACVAFELATGEVMFAPTNGEGFNENERYSNLQRFRVVTFLCFKWITIADST
ncbi:hypothetical protein MKW94_028538, partial [Papaver nudicaule]|nr:hypothetical protein [Papaver nudicaule]